MTMPGSVKLDAQTEVVLNDSCNCRTAIFCCLGKRKKHVKGCPSDPKVCSAAKDIFESK